MRLLLAPISLIAIRRCIAEPVDIGGLSQRCIVYTWMNLRGYVPQYSSMVLVLLSLFKIAPCFRNMSIQRFSSSFALEIAVH